jgi:lipooligosaccharide transport system ATP-binding protein
MTIMSEQARADAAIDAAIVLATGLRKSYGSFEALAGVDFAVTQGECFGFLGPNGAGKTTTMRLIAAAGPPTAGRLTVFGLPIERHGRAIKRRLGVVPQEDSLDLELTVLENLLVYARYFDIPGAEAKRRAHELLDFLQLSEKKSQNVVALSGGMKRRLMIARGLINEPEILILDEPTTGLDPQARHLVWEKLRQLKGRRTTLLLTTHYMDEAEQLCDRLVVMEAGRILAEGAPRQLIRQYVTREVLELHGTREERESALAALDGKAGAYEMLEDRLLIYVEDADELLRQLASGRSSAEFLLRRATLEDVFLKLTGRRLSE